VKALAKGLMGAAQGALGGLHNAWETEQRQIQTQRLLAAKRLEDEQIARINAQYQVEKEDRKLKNDKELATHKATEQATARATAQGPLNVGPGGAVYDPKGGGVLFKNDFKPSNIAFETVNMPDGSTMQVQRDPTTGVMYGLGGGQMNAPLPRGGGTPTQAVPQPDGGTVDMVSALEAELGRTLTPEEAAQVQSGGQFDIPADVPAGFGQGQTPTEAQYDRTTGELAAKRDAGQPKAETRLGASLATADNAIATIERALGNVGHTTAGIGGAILGRVPGTGATDMAGDIDSLQAVLSFTELQKMRENSPTGGALGGIAVRELDLLAATIASLKQEQSPERLKENLTRIQTHLHNWKDTMQEAYSRTYGQSQAPLQQPAQAPATNGFRVIGVR
jgi:hypothetical protein